MDIEFSYQKSGGWNEVEPGVWIDGPLWVVKLQHDGLEAIGISINDEIEALDFALRVLKGEGPYPPEPIRSRAELTEEDEKWFADHYRSKYDMTGVMIDHGADGVSIIEI